MPATSFGNADAIQQNLSGGESVYKMSNLGTKKLFYSDRVRCCPTRNFCRAPLRTMKVEKGEQRDQRDQREGTKEIRGARNFAVPGRGFPEIQDKH